MDTGHWQYLGDFNPEDWFGFIYRIVDLTNNRHYLGKKQFQRHLRKTIVGKKNKKKVTKESDWKKYVSSSMHVQAAIVEKGKENFLFLIESLHKTKGSLTYAEVEAQINEDVLRAVLPSGERKYYNGMVANVKFIPPAESSDEALHKIGRTSRVFSQNTDHHFQMTDEEKASWALTYRFSRGESLLPAELDQLKKNIQQEPAPVLQKPKAKTKEAVMLVCPHCKKEGKTNMARYHFDNCKLKK